MAASTHAVSAYAIGPDIVVKSTSQMRLDFMSPTIRVDFLCHLVQMNVSLCFGILDLWIFKLSFWDLGASWRRPGACGRQLEASRRHLRASGWEHLGAMSRPVQL